MAQWLAQETHNPLVAGSNPAGPTFLPGFSIKTAYFQRKIGCFDSSIGHVNIWSSLQSKP